MLSVKAIDTKIIGAFALTILDKLISFAKKKGESIAVDVIAKSLAASLGKLPLSVRGDAITMIANSTAIAVADALRLSDARREALIAALGAELLEAVTKESATAASTLETNMNSNMEKLEALEQKWIARSKKPAT